MEIIKSKSRVKQDGEVFTPNKIVYMMLHLPGIHDKLKNIHATFMETSAGEGAFLLRILKSKMYYAYKISKDTYHYNRNVLIAISSIYGIELLEDNFSMLILNIDNMFRHIYNMNIKKYKSKPNPKVLKSAKVIINANIVQGNSLNGKDGNNKPIVLSEWKLVSKYKVRRINFYYNSDIHKDEQISLFNNDTLGSLSKYVPVDIIDVYKQLLITNDK